MSFTLAIMPWLRIYNPLAFCGVKFIPYKDDLCPEVFKSYSDEIIKILSSYRGIEGKNISECILICLAQDEPCKNLEESDVARIVEASQFLSFCGLSNNEYFCQGGRYINSSAFQVFFQRFDKACKYIALTTRRRDGMGTHGGYKHGEVRFSIPVQCAHLMPCSVDVSLLEALDKLFGHPDSFSQRLLQSVSLFNQANSDSDTVLPQREIVLLATAYEHLFVNCQGADDLACKVSALLDNYGSVPVSKSGRKPSIGKEAEKQWFLHRKWIQELYQLRNDFTHGNDIRRRLWGWSIGEHLVMASFLFPLLVKIQLSQLSRYCLVDNDIVQLEVIDTLLDKKGWDQVAGSDRETRWRETIRKHSSDRALGKAFDAAWEKIQEGKNPGRDATKTQKAS